MSVTLHTNVGDIKIELFCDQVRREGHGRGPGVSGISGSTRL